MPKAKCPTCASVVSYAAGYDPVCPNCGFRGEAPAQPRPAWTSVSSAASVAPIAQPAAPPAPMPPRAYVAQGYATAPGHGREQGMATGALVCGLLAFIIPPLALVAVILGAIAMSQADRDPMRYGGKGMAITGLVLGIIVGVFWLAVVGIAGDVWLWDW